MGSGNGQLLICRFMDRLVTMCNVILYNILDLDEEEQECFNACVSGCGFRFDIPVEKVEEIKPDRPSKPPPPEIKRATSSDSAKRGEDVPCTSA
ncbi:hypothetical protein ACP70R_010704 [Stipagrostis hirtigluma subsp. patula]